MVQANAGLTITRTLLGLGDLTFTSDRTSNWVLELVGRPGKVPINTVASSGLVHGDVVIRSRLQQATIPLSLLVQGSTVALVEGRIDAVEDAFAQFTYGVSVDIDGTVRGYSCDPSPVTPEGPTEPYVSGHVARLAVVLSAYPLASS